ncbi:MAG TPA: S8 family serine peptidase [Rhodoblastus sp.]|nr:S8 family serine peptidase [Rhodoblastus sp.]
MIRSAHGPNAGFLVGAAISIAVLGASTSHAADKQSFSPKSSQAAVIAKEIGATGLTRVVVTVSTALPAATIAQHLASDDHRSTALAAIADAARTVATRHFGPMQTANGFAISRFSTSPSFAVTVNKAQLDALNKDPAVLAIRSDHVARTQLDVTTVTIGMPATWTVGATGAGRTVAVIDTGVQTNHPFIGTARVALEGCFLATAGCPNGTNEQKGVGAANPANNGIAHGTHVAGIAIGKNTVTGAAPAAGVAKVAKLFAINVFDSDGFARDSSMVRALEYVEDRVINQPVLRITSVNLSIGGGDYGDYCDSVSPEFKAVVDRLRLKRVAVVISAGNDGYGNMMSWPGCISSVVSVGATNRHGNTVAYYSNIDTSTRLLAPGGDVNNGGAVVSSVLNSAYAGYQGTSMAAPHVAGAFAALATKFPTMQITLIEDALRRSGVAVADNRVGSPGVSVPRIRVKNAFDLLTAATPPKNDAFSAAVNIVSLDDLDVWGSTGNGSREAGEPAHGNGPSSWWKWTAPTSQRVALSTLGSNFDTVLAVYKGPSVGALTRVAFNNNADATEKSSVVEFNAVAGTTYRIAVGGVASNSTGVVHLTGRTVPANDNFAKARSAVISRTAMTLITGNNFNASLEPGEPTAHGINSVWWKFTVPASGSYTFDTVGSMTRNGAPLDTKIAIYTGSTLNALTLVGSDDDSGYGSYSQLTISAAAGTTYYLAVGSVDYATLQMPDESGNLRINVTPPGFVYQGGPAARTAQAK